MNLLRIWEQRSLKNELQVREMYLCTVWKCWRKEYDMNSPEGKTEFMKEDGKKAYTV